MWPSGGEGDVDHSGESAVPYRQRWERATEVIHLLDHSPSVATPMEGHWLVPSDARIIACSGNVDQLNARESWVQFGPRRPPAAGHTGRN